MKIGRVIGPATDGEPSVGVIEGQNVYLYDRSGGGAGFGSVKNVCLDDVKAFLPPEPPNVFAIGLNYRDHAAEGNMDVPKRPVVFLKATTAVIGHQQPIMLPSIAPDEVDFEAELAVVIGETAKNVPSEDALDYVMGYTCANDVSARDCQLKLDQQWARAKSFDTFAPIGPWIETEVDPSDLMIRSILNGDVMQESSTSQMIFPVEELVSFLSRCFTLQPGTVILTGTPAGVGAARDPEVFLRPGDTIEIEIEGVGTLTNPVRAAAD
ncbi:MAG: fumarylacetoacetate hydrolase family protein [Planctomycetota bacterium]